MKTIFYKLEPSIRYLKYIRRYKRIVKDADFSLDIRDTEETLNKILKNRYSISRYGDGELGVMEGKGNGFCNYNSFLADKLKIILSEEVDGHIVGLPHSMINQENMNLRTKVFWIAFFCKTYTHWKKYLKPGRVYYDAELTRFYFKYKNKVKCAEYIKKIKELWEQREIVLIEGEYSRLGVNNNLFDNAKSVQRILAPACNAYLKYDEIMEKAREWGKEKLILLALGQTATALSYDLAKENFWAIDIGHLDVEYEWFLRKTKKKIKILGKHVNEAKYLPMEERFYNEAYEKQIVARIL